MFYCIIHKLTETGKDDAKKGDQMEKLQQGEEVDIDMSDPDVAKAATKIQASFRGHKAREDVKKQKDEEAAALKIQASFRGHKAREQVKEIRASRSDVQVSASVDAVGEAGIVEKVPDDEPPVSGEAEVAEEPVKQEDAAEDQAPDAQPDDSAAVEAEDVEPEADKEEPVEQEGQPDGAVAAEGAEGVDVAGKEEAEVVQAEEAATEEAATVEAAEAAKATEKAEDAEKEEDKEENKEEDKEEDKAEKEEEVVADEQASVADGGKVEGEEEQIDLDMNDPELQGAVVKIQASFRGHKAREQVKALKSSESLPQGGEEVASEEKTEDEKQEAAEGEKDKGNDDAEPSVAEDADESKPSED